MSRHLCSVLIGIVVLGLSPVVQADLPRDIFRSLELFATPSGNFVQTFTGGLRVNGQRLGQTRIEPNVLGDGWEIIVDRTFGPDSAGRPETFDLGPIDLTLQGATSTTANYTTRGFLQANLNSQISALNYALTATTGPVDATLAGTLNMNNALSINEFGFYELQVDFDQTNAQLLVETLGETDTTEMNFSIGPVDVRGNIFFDAFVGILSLLGVDTTALDPLTGRSAVAELTRQFDDAVADALAEEGFALETANGEVEFVPLTASPTNPITDDTAAPFVGPLLPSLPEDVGADAPAAAVPEPASAALLALALLAVVRRR